MIVLHGRRRIGKTELIEQFFQDKNLWKFEGIQTPPPKRGPSNSSLEKQLAECAKRLGQYLEKQDLFRSIKLDSWSEFFELVSPIAEKEKLTLYFEEVQWLAGYGSDFFAYLKPFWDDRWRHNKNLRIIFSGSSPSFLVSQFLADKALYNRSQHTFGLKPFALQEISEYLGKLGPQEKLLAAICVGGVPEYLKRVRKSVLQNLLSESFVRDGFFHLEIEKVFVSSMAHNKNYKGVLESLAVHGSATRAELAKRLGITQSRPGGSFSALLDDLENCGFIESYSSVERPNSDKLKRLRISDEMLVWYFRLIRPRESKISNGVFEDTWHKAVSQLELHVFLGFAFERWCLSKATLIAKALKFHGIVDYEFGSFFGRKNLPNASGFQIDLMFVRKDFKLLIVESKYTSGKAPSLGSHELLDKAEKLLQVEPKFKRYSIETVLVTNAELSDQEKAKYPVDHVVDLEDLFSAE